MWDYLITNNYISHGLIYSWLLYVHNVTITLRMLRKIFNFFLLKVAKNLCFHQKCLLIYYLSVKQFGSKMRPHILWGFILIQIVLQRSSKVFKFAVSGQRDNDNSISSSQILINVCLKKITTTKGGHTCTLSSFIFKLYWNLYKAIRNNNIFDKAIL